MRGHRLAWSRIPTQLRYRPGALAVVGSNPTGPTSILSLYLVPCGMTRVLMQSLAEEKDVTSSAYGMFNYSIRNELTRKYYERRLKTFFDYTGFEVHSDLETRCNLFAKRGADDGK